MLKRSSTRCFIRKWKTVEYYFNLCGCWQTHSCPVLLREQVLAFLFVWKLEASEADVLSNVLLACGLVLPSTSHGGSLASGAMWLSSMSRRYWCLAMKYSMCWDVAKAPPACRRCETVITLGYPHTISFISLCNGVCLVFVRVPAVLVRQCIWF